MTKSLNDRWLEIVDEYEKTHGRNSFTLIDVVAWAKETGRWQADPKMVTRLGVAELKGAFKSVERVDRKGLKIWCPPESAE